MGIPFVGIIAVCIVFSVFIIKSQGRFSPHPYNLILISIDTLRPDHMSLYGYSRQTTPSIDAWAKKQAVIFTNMYTAVPMTYPSFTTLMTGVPPWEMGIFSNGNILQADGDVFHETKIGNPNIPTSMLTLAEVLRNNNYQTIAYTSNGILSQQITNIDKGFDTYVYDPSDEKVDFSSKKTIKKTLTFLSQRTNNGKPFFLWTHLMEPHSPYYPDKTTVCKLTPTLCSKVRQTDLRQLEKERTALQGCQLKPIDPSSLSLFSGLYDGDIAKADTYVGQLLVEIQKQGLDKDSVIVIYGDHGEGLDHNYYFTHSATLYESQIHIPLIISFPGAKNNGQESDVLLQNTQIMPTLLKLLGVKAPQTFSLPDFAATIDETRFPASGTAVEKPLYFMNANDNVFAVRQGDYKYIYTVPIRAGSCLKQYPPEQLFNIKNDPGETKNLLGQEHDKVGEMKYELINALKMYSPDLSSLPAGYLRADKPKQTDEKILNELKSLGY